MGCIAELTTPLLGSPEGHRGATQGGPPLCQDGSGLSQPPVSPEPGLVGLGSGLIGWLSGELLSALQHPFLPTPAGSASSGSPGCWR